MQRTVTVFLACLAALALTGCPDKEKKAEKEEPAAPTAVDKNADEKNAAEDEHGEEQADEHGEEPTDKKPVKRKRAEKAAEEKDQGGW